MTALRGSDGEPDRPHWFWEMLASIVTLGGYESSYERDARRDRTQRGSEWGGRR